MKKVICIGESILSPLGETVKENFEAVLRGESALRLHTGTFGVKEPFVASLMDRSRWTVAGQSFFDSIVIEAARRAVEASGIDPASPRTAFVLSSIKEYRTYWHAGCYIGRVRKKTGGRLRQPESAGGGFQCLHFRTGGPAARPADASGRRF